MLYRKLFFVLSLGTTALFATGCGEDMGKLALTVGGAAGGAYVSSQLASPENKTLSTVLGAGAGGALGYLLGGAIAPHK